MTVAELIAELQKMPQDAKVEIWRMGEPMSPGDEEPRDPPELDADGVVQL